MIVIKGYERKSGTFTPSGSNDEIAYDNVILHLVNDDKCEGFCGARCEQLKVKTKDLSNLFGCSYEGLSMYLDTPITFNYAFRNGKANLVSVSVADSKESFNFES